MRSKVSRVKNKRYKRNSLKGSSGRNLTRKYFPTNRHKLVNDLTNPNSVCKFRTLTFEEKKLSNSLRNHINSCLEVILQEEELKSLIPNRGNRSLKGGALSRMRDYTGRKLKAIIAFLSVTLLWMLLMNVVGYIIWDVLIPNDYFITHMNEIFKTAEQLCGKKNLAEDAGILAKAKAHAMGVIGRNEIEIGNFKIDFRGVKAMVPFIPKEAMSCEQATVALNNLKTKVNVSVGSILVVPLLWLRSYIMRKM